MTADDRYPRPPEYYTDAEEREVTIRCLEGEDVDALVEMYERFDPADRAQGIPPTEPSRIHEWLEGLLDGGVDVIASHEGRLVGHATLVPGAEGGAHELAIFVLGDYRGAGIGTRILRHALGTGADRGIDRVWLSVERWNAPAIAVYEKVGFERSTTDRFELEMALEL